MRNALSWLIGCVFLAGCAAESSRYARGLEESGQAEAYEVTSTSSLFVVNQNIGTSRQGRAINALSVGRGTNVALVVAGIHGNEQAGIALAERLVEDAAGGGWLGNTTFVVVPVLNPDGVAGNRRYNGRNVDLNRNWPSENRIESASNNGPSPLSEPESAALAKYVEGMQPDRVLTLHQPLSCVDWDGPADSLARRIAAACDLPAKQLGSRPGSMGSYLGVDQGIPIITLELPRSADQQSEAERWEQYGEALRVFVRG